MGIEIAMKLTALLILIFAATAEAQQFSRPEIKATVGWVGFIDEDFIDHGVFGGAVRYYITSRLAVEPEALYMVGPGSDRDFTLIPHVSFDFLGRPKVQPYAIGGVGWLRHSQRFGPMKFTNNEWVINGGVGVKIFLTPRLFVAPEFRMGFETTARVTASIGFLF